MAKITTIIDIGSNSMRMVVFKKTSRFAFHLINESKSKVKISQGSYENNGNLQQIPMQRAFEALRSFLDISKNLKSRKILCVATSALRDAPNKKEFLTKVSKELKLNIKIIDGQKEAYYGGVAALNLLALDDFVTIDIGGGSCEFAFVENKHILDTVSLKIGTVRIGELFFNHNNLDDAKKYIHNQIEQNKTTFDQYKKLFKNIVGLGGTARALTRIIIDKSKSPIDTIHGFRYKFDDEKDLFKHIIKAQTTKELKVLGVRKDRYDTIATGTFIFQTILEYFEVKHITTSGAGVREGVYLTDMLRGSNHIFPANFNISVRSLLDRFVDDEQQSKFLGANASKIFDILKPIHNLDDKYRSILVIASKLQLIGISLNVHKHEDHAFWYILHGLNYGFTHKQKALIATIAKFTTKSLPTKKDIKSFKSLLPDIQTIRFLNFMMTLNIILFKQFNNTKYQYKLENRTLTIIAPHNQYLVKQELDKMETIDNIQIVYKVG